jgi:four helix bundle protein
MSERVTENPWDEADEGRLCQEEPVRVFDLEERSAQFGESVLRMLKTVAHSPLTNRLIEQLVGCATSIGANYAEADDSVSPKDFRHRIGICRKESRESKHFLRMLATASETHAPECRRLYREARELNLIFSAIWRRSSPGGEMTKPECQNPKP